MTREEAKEAVKEAYGNSEYTDEIIEALEQEPMLDKIRAEIEALKNAPPCFDDMFEYKCAVDDVLAITDKYKAEK